MRLVSDSTNGIEMPIINLTKNSWLATKVKKADSFITRLVGLLKRRNLGPEEALWLVPSKGIHTIGMKLPIDIIFLDRGNKVINLISSLSPYRVSSFYFRAVSLVELPNGVIKKSHTEVGDQLEVSMAESSEMDDLRETRLSQVN